MDSALEARIALAQTRHVARMQALEDAKIARYNAYIQTQITIFRQWLLEAIGEELLTQLNPIYTSFTSTNQIEARFAFRGHVFTLRQHDKDYLPVLRITRQGGWHDWTRLVEQFDMNPDGVVVRMNDESFVDALLVALAEMSDLPYEEGTPNDL